MNTQHAIRQCQQLVDEITALEQRRKHIITETNQELKLVTNDIFGLLESLAHWTRVASNQQIFANEETKLKRHFDED